jgi:uncharacterized protein YjbI with pentapeptide repeats
MPTRRPCYDDEAPLGLGFFRTRVAGDFSNLTLPRTFFSRSEVIAAQFLNTDLSESTLCWNDFIRVEFCHANLRGGDLRAAIFNGVDFSRCDLRETDLRHSTFIDCDFANADMLGAKWTRGRAVGLKLSVRQQESIAWQDDEGEEPGGG